MIVKCLGVLYVDFSIAIDEGWEIWHMVCSHSVFLMDLTEDIIVFEKFKKKKNNNLFFISRTSTYMSKCLDGKHYNGSSHDDL